MQVPRTTDKAQLMYLLARLRRLAAAHKAAHYEAAKSNARTNKWMRISSIILSASVAGSLFYTLEIVLGPGVKIVMALASLAAASLTVIQIFLRSAEKADSHKIFASKFSSFERRVEVLLASPPRTVDGLRNEVETLDSELTAIASYAPFVLVESDELVLSPTS